MSRCYRCNSEMAIICLNRQHTERCLQQFGACDVEWRRSDLDRWPYSMNRGENEPDTKRHISTDILPHLKAGEDVSEIS